MLWQEPLLADVALGSSDWFALQRRLIESKPLLRRCYDDWYRRMLADEASVPAAATGLLVELGSGGSRLVDHCPQVLTSDVVPGVASRVIDARELPFEAGTVRALFLTHALHHVPQVERFFAEAQRVLVPGGVVSMIEVAHTPLAKFFFTHLHPEPYDDRTQVWDFAQSDSMADANQALSWLVFSRDRQRFQNQFAQLQIERKELLPWAAYLASGGVTRRTLLPGPLAGLAVALDAVTRPVAPLLALHWHVTLRKSA
jgi:SAM-dependent methyltransferase